MRLASRRGLQVGLLFFCVLTVNFVLAQSASSSAAAAASALQTGDYARALELLRPALQQSPGSPQLWTLQAIAYAGEGHKADALASFRAALKISPDYLAALEGAAQIEYDKGSDAAIPLLKHILALHPNDEISHAMLAVLAYKHGDCPTAVEHFESSGPLTSSQPVALEQYGSCLVKLQKYDKAIPVFQAVLDRNANDNQARYRLAAVQLMAEKPKDAVATLQPLLDAKTGDAKTQALAASAYEASGDTPQAVQTLRSAIVSDPRDTDLYLDFANLSMDHQSFQVGIDMINSGLRLQPNAAQLYVARGILYVQLAQYDFAEADFEKANTLDPAASIGSVAQGLEAVQSSDPDKALALVRAKLQKKPNDPYLLYLEADILSQKGVEAGTPEFATAMRSAKKAVTLQPSLAAVHDVLAKLYLLEGQNQLAIEQCRKALASDPKDQTALYHLIQGMRKSGAKTSETSDLLKRLAELREESTKLEGERNRYRLIEQNAPVQSAQP
jgi:tetratricopeptide (TPR) repeat protein